MEIKTFNDLSNIDSTISNTSELIQIVNNEDFGWIYKTYDTSQKRVKCKNFQDDGIDYLIKNQNKQKLINKIKTNLLDFNNENVVTLTFIISNKGVKFGKIDDGLEFGTQHLHLIEADDEKTIIGGEMEVNFTDRIIKYNLLSGTFSLDIFKEIENEIEKNRYRDGIKNLIEKVFKMQTDFDIEYVNDTVLLPKGRPFIDKMRNICKLSYFDLINGIITSDENKKCTQNSLTRIPDNEIRTQYLHLSNLMKEDQINFLNENLSCHPFIGQEKIDFRLEELIKSKLSDISSVKYNEEIHINNTSLILQKIKPKYWISSPVSRAISTGYFFSILSNYHGQYITINELWRELDTDFGMLFQSKGGVSSVIESGEDKKYAWGNFKNGDLNCGTAILEKIKKDNSKFIKNIDIFKKYYIDTIPDLSSNIVWLTGHGGTSKLYAKSYCNNLIEINEGNIIQKNINSIDNLKFGESYIINQKNCYTVKKSSDIDHIINYITQGKILILTRHLRPNTDYHVQYWNVGQPTKLDFPNINIKRWPGRPIYPTKIDISNITEEFNDFPKPLTISVLYGSDNLDIMGI